MPTYQVTSILKLVAAQKRSIAQNLTALHVQHTGAARHVVQVIFRTLDADDHYLGGHRVADLQRPHVWLLCMSKAGRPEQIKQQILKDARDVLIEAMKLEGTSQVTCYMQEIDWQKGNLVSDSTAENLALKDD